MSTTSPLVTGSHLNSNGTTHRMPPSGSADIRGELMAMTPTMAADLLKRKLPNRRLSKARVRVMIEDMRAGRWRVNGESIILTEDLEVIDGQHRLMAVAESGITVEFLVVVGISPDVAMSIDQGRAKVGGDMLSMSGMTTNAPLLASTARWLHRYERGTMRQQTSALRNDELPHYVEGRPALATALPWGRTTRDLAPAAVGAMLYFVMNTTQPVLAKSYFDALANGNDLGRDHPAHIIREKLLRDNSPRSHAGIVKRAALVVLGWNACRSERSIPAGVVWKGASDEGEPFPQVM